MTELGFSLVLASGALVRPFVHMADELLAVLGRDGATTRFGDRILTFAELNSRLGLEETARQGERFDPALKLEAYVSGEP